MSAITTTLVVDLAGGQAELKAEIDTRPEGLNGGKSQFTAADEIWILVETVGCNITEVTASSGQLSAGAAVTIQTKYEPVSYAPGSPAKTKSRIENPAGVSAIWRGNKPPVFNAAKDGSLSLQLSDGKAYDKPAAGLVTYTTKYKSYKLKPPNEAKTAKGPWPILVYIKAEEEAPT